MMNNVYNQETLATIRTLLALERNYMAEERTHYAELRTGMALTVFGPIAGTFIAYFLQIFDIKTSGLFDILDFIFFILLTLIGAYISILSNKKLKIIRKKRDLLNEYKLIILDKPEEFYNLYKKL